MSTPATPGQAAPAQEPSQPATPGTSPANVQTPPSTPSATPAAPEGQVMISPKEYAQLQRDRARLQGLQRRSTTRGGAQAADPNDPNFDGNEALAAERNRARELEQQIFERDVRDRARDLLAKPEYAALPESTRKLILRNPHALSEAKDLDEVIMDVEDFLREESAALKATAPQHPTAQPGQQPAQQPTSPAGHDTPPKVAAGSPQAPHADQLEDVSNLTGPARSQAILRNAMKKARGVQA